MSKTITKARKNSLKTKQPNNGGTNGFLALSQLDINTEQGQIEATNGLWTALASGTADSETTKLLLSTIGKVLGRENIKIRTGFYKLSNQPNKFFALPE